jgi:DNA-binding MarR family transcriptional regulator
VKVDLSLYDKLLENRIRLQIMSVLVVNEEYDYNSLKELLDVTDGNLASNLKALEKAGYIEVYKTFVDRKPNTRYKCTLLGANSFKNHLNALEQIIKSSQ